MPRESSVDWDGTLRVLASCAERRRCPCLSPDEEFLPLLALARLAESPLVLRGRSRDPVELPCRLAALGVQKAYRRCRASTAEATLLGEVRPRGEWLLLYSGLAWPWWLDVRLPVLMLPVG